MQILLNHVVLEDISASAIMEAVEASPTGAVMVPALFGDLEVSMNTTAVTIKPAGTDIVSTVLTADVETCVGTVHVVDRVLVPSIGIVPDGAVAVAPAPAMAELAASEGAFEDMMDDIADAPGPGGAVCSFLSTTFSFRFQGTCVLCTAVVQCTLSLVAAFIVRWLLQGFCS